MKPLTVADPQSKSQDSVANNIAILRELFPEVFNEGKVDFDVLKQMLGGSVAEPDEKYGLNWHGKRAARQLALTPSMGTLRPVLDDSVDWETTRNIVIEGDNLEVLKLLQKSYSGKVKLIYIDPPYNTGGDFVYKDDFRDSIGNYQRTIGDIDDTGNRLTTNSEAGGRFHTNWLNMMYPRLKLARNLLREDGIIAVSIDDHEFARLHEIMSEVFGEENSLVVFVWKRRTGAMDSVNNVSTDHEYIVCFSRTSISLAGEARTFEKYSNSDGDSRGDWIADNLSAAKPGGDTFYPIKDPQTGFEYWPPKGRFWPYSRETMARKIAENRIIFPGRKDGTPLLKRFKNEAKSIVQPVSSWINPNSMRDEQNGSVKSLTSGHTSEGTKIVKELFGEKIFVYAKPMSLITELLVQAGSSERDDIILDFFAGSGTTGHAVMALNAEVGNRRFILVQLPEPLNPSADDQKTAAEFCKTLGKPLNIAELTKERLRRAGKKVKAETPMFAGDIGFRVYKLDSSNIRPWDPKPDDLEGTVWNSVEHIKDGRTPDDILTELLLKLGLDLCVPIETKTIADKVVHSVGGGVLLVCLDEKITTKQVEELALGIVEWHKALAPAGDSQAVFRDSAFEDDIGKTNLTAILAQHGLTNVRSL
ncbi:site-specific DNA-methyltransferase [Tuwongella immobilis]|uniref:site-specific DNA-methyltransferase (adenine-specific) n=1 Tax=Tuwongella immobilis TaxID=692036 RepID=A0A6C2YI24_9BACT|nr:site-specific DNA-methyltransferase [Tuwongella immobilis]VIP01077.1 dna methylase family protein : Type III restriction system methylase OS=Bordetella petrii (strain ATCC BAA-461 / DSM 12804 / CCUG 43448) GN=mod PE=4 SV=1: N6_N4_Mtase [Tuwongella immobilis]VTR97579.1 dna methylase family protein : Type III restriction system methylase OS=Bordetella petrii (strain ATCC BAA-461 / DSM 12804 / CCUG 43448) GN=mod PE=4 SV=1: N6_N4_Mtase [Tuwongella immobilis]